MKKTLLKGMLLASILIYCHHGSSQKPEWAGVWGIWGGHNFSNQVYPWYKGAMVHTTWKDIQPERNSFVFTHLDNQVITAVNNGLYVGFMVYISPNFAPEWLYTEAGVPKVVLRNGDTSPYYFDENFKTEFKNMVSAVSDHIDNYPENIRNKVVIVQAIVAKSGDPQPWNSEPVDPQYSISQWWNHAGWRDYTREMYSHYYNLFHNKNPRIIVLLKPVANNEVWSNVNLPGGGRKAFSPGQGYHLGREDQYFYQYNSIRDYNILGVREEFDEAIKRNTAWFNAAPVWNVYWTGLFSLTYGLDIWNHRTEFMNNNPNQHAYALNFFTDWAGYKKAEMSSGAWVAFRDDIDGADLTRFPESVYGAYNNGLNPTRNSAIAEAFSAYGAKQDDPDFVVTNYMLDVVFHQNGINDVQSRVWRGNYGMFMNQVNANETSQGYWRVGSKDQPFGRFARGFNHEQGKNAIYLDIDDKVFEESVSPNGTTAVDVEIVYFDDGSGKWEIRYDALDDADKTAISVTNSNSGVWKTLNITLEDAKFSNRGPLNSDISIINSDDVDNIFHMVKVVKSEGVSSKSNLMQSDKVVHCWPNPFNPNLGVLNISYQGIENEDSVLRIYDIKGLLISEIKLSGKTINNQGGIWDGRNRYGQVLPDGLYLGKIYNETNILNFRIVIIS